jgi:ribosomal protein S18 acetylase RimI-like enzyme
MNPNIKIRPFKISDYSEIIELWKRIKLPFKPKGRDRISKIKREINNQNTFFLVALIEHRIIGTVLGTHDGRKGWINRLAVHPDFQHQGIGTLLLKEVEKQINKSGIDIIACLIEEDNPDSMLFFQKSGYLKNEDIIYFTKKKTPDT